MKKSSPSSQINQPPKPRKLTNKMKLWQRNYLNAENPKTFLNATESARKAGYNIAKDNYNTVGWQNYTKLRPIIEKWLNDYGLDENSLKIKLKSLMEAKEVKYFAFEGKICDQVEVDALEIQRKALEMAMKVKGMFEKDNEQAAAKVLAIVHEADEKAQAIVSKYYGGSPENAETMKNIGTGEPKNEK